MTFEDEDEDRFEEGGGGATPLPKIPMTIGKNVPKHGDVDVVYCSSQLRQD